VGLAVGLAAGRMTRCATGHLYSLRRLFSQKVAGPKVDERRG
jgi:hypothetical protein